MHYIEYQNISAILRSDYLVNPQNLKENLFLIYLKTKKPLKKSTKKKKII